MYNERPSISKFEVFITKLQRGGAKVPGSGVTSLEFVVRSTLLQNAQHSNKLTKPRLNWKGTIEFETVFM